MSNVDLIVGRVEASEACLADLRRPRLPFRALPRRNRYLAQRYGNSGFTDEFTYGASCKSGQFLFEG